MCDDQGTVEVEGQADAQNGEDHLVLGRRQVGAATAPKQESEKDDLRKQGSRVKNTFASDHIMHALHSLIRFLVAVEKYCVLKLFSQRE